MDSRRTVVLVIAAGLLGAVLLPAAYAGSYWALVKAECNEPDYAIESDLVTRFYAPAHKVDREIRPEYWGGW